MFVKFDETSFYNAPSSAIALQIEEKDPSTNEIQLPLPTRDLYPLEPLIVLPIVANPLPILSSAPTSPSTETFEVRPRVVVIPPPLGNQSIEEIEADVDDTPLIPRRSDRMNKGVPPLRLEYNQLLLAHLPLRSSMHTH